MKPIDVLAKLKLGLSPEEVAKLLETTPDKVIKIRDDAIRAGVLARPRKPQAARAERRREIAEAVKNGMTITDAAKEFGVSRPTVKIACDEHGVASREAKPKGSEHIATTFKVAAMIQDGATDAEIGRGIGCSREWAGRLRQLAQEAGLKF